MIGKFFSTFLPVFKSSLKRFVYGSLFVVLFLYFFVRCVDFSIYSDANEVKAVKADIVTTDDVIIDKEEIVSGEEGRILLNVKGKIEDCLPLTIRTDFELSAQAKILYQEKYREFVFRDLQDSFRFQVVAQSGLPKRWTIKLMDVRSHAGNIVRFRVDSYKAEADVQDLVEENGRIYQPNLVEVFVNANSDAVFPLEVVPDIRISENSTLIDYEAGTPLRFESAHSICKLKVRAENKSVQDWKIAIRTPESDDVNLKGGGFIAFTDCLEVADTVFVVDTTQANATVKVAQVSDWKNFNVMLQYNLRLPVGAHWEFLDGETEDFSTSRVIFNGIEDIRRFKIVSQSGKEKIWKIKLDYRYDRKAWVTNFSIDSWQPSEKVNVSVNSTQAVDTALQKVYIEVNDGVKEITDKTPLIVYPVVKLSDKAGIKGVEAGQNNVYRLPAVSFAGIGSQSYFSVFSESGEEYKWTIELVNKQQGKDANAELENIMLHAEKLPAGVAFTNDIFMPAENSQEVVLKLDKAKFPFLLAAEAYAVKISAKAKLPDGLKDLVFENISDRKTIRVEAENGTEKIWTVRLDYKQNAGADITAFKISQVFPADVTFEREGTIDAEVGRVTLGVTDAGSSFPLRMDVAVVVSANAHLQTELKSLVFTNEEQVHRVNVVAESGIVREWVIGLKNQIVKSDKAILETLVAVPVDPEVQLGNVGLAENAGYVEILAGKNRFPLSLDINGSEFSEGATPDKVILTFANISRKEMVKVTSRNGKVTNTYTVGLKDLVPPGDSADIVLFRLERYQPLDYKLSGNVEIDRTSGKVWIEVYGGMGALPLIVWPDIKVSDAAVLQTGLPANGLEFRSAADVNVVKVVAENKTVKTWQIGIRELALPKNTEAVVEQVEAANKENIVVQPVVKENNEVIMYIGNAQPAYPFTVTATLSVSPNATVKVVGNTVPMRTRTLKTQTGVQVVRELDLTFNSSADKIGVEVISEDASVSNVYNFKLGGDKVKNTEANVVEYKIESYIPMNMEEAPLVFGPDTEQGLITINAPDESAFPFTIYTKMRLSYGAELKGLNPSQMTFERGFTGQDFEVISESGQVKKWRLQVKVAEKSKENNVTAFEIASYTPETAGLGKPEIRTEQRKIVIPVKDWQKGSRLTVDVGKMELSPKASSDFRSSLFFQSAKDEYTFHVTAQNGDVAEWKVVLDYTFSDQADITSFRVLAGDPAVVTYHPEAVIDAKTNTVYIDVIENLTFPFTVTTDIAYSAKTEVDAGGMADNRIRFDKYQDSTVIRVTAEDEATRKAWKVKLRYHFSEEADITAFHVEASVPAAVVFASPATTIDESAHTVWVNVADWGGQTNLQITPSVKISDKASCNLSGDLLFVKKTSESKTVHVTAESGKVVAWTVKLKYEENSGADITAVKYTGYVPGDINFLGASIDAKTGVVTLELQTWNGHTEFTLKGVACTLSPKATATIPADMTFRKQIQESLEYVVTAQDGTQKKWTFKLLYHESNAAEVTRFRITGNNKPGIISMATTGVLGDGTIDIDLNSGVRDAFESGFQINVEVELSAKSTSNFPATMMFSKPTDQRKYTVTAESGTAKEWTVRFVNKASQDASLLALKGASIVSATTSNTGDFKFTDLKLSGTTASMTITDVMTLNKYDRNWPTLDIALDMQLSARAKVKEGTQVSMNIGNPGNKTLTVVADDGIHQQVYTLEIAYKPQLDNGSLDSWNDNKTPSGNIWSTANNTFVSGTTKTTGKSGSAALLTTSEAVGMKAAGTIFLGSFKFTSLTDALNDPEKMTHFGIAFPVRPKQVKVDVQYKQGNGVLNDGSRDKGQVWAALEYWPDPTNAKNPANKRYAYGEVMLTQNVGSWTTYTITLNVTDASVTPTHFLFVASSSYDGNHFNAVNGSEMRVDNVELVY